MNKTFLIIKREYLSRVTKKTFILTTFLTPLLFIGLIASVIFITVKGVKQEKIAVDANTPLKEFLTGDNNLKFDFIANVDTSLLSKGYTGILLEPGKGINKSPVYQVYSRKSKSDDVTRKIRNQVNEALRATSIMKQANLTRQQYDSMMMITKEAQVANQVLDETNHSQQGNFEVASAVGYAAGFLIYITLFLYGVMVMRGVMEEKTNRIAEVIMSSVKPWQLMIGKIIGIGAVGLTQFLLWIILMFALTTALSSIIPHDILVQAQQAQNGMPNNGMNQQGSEAIRHLAEMKTTFSTVNWPLIVTCFIFYFIGGYLFYAALFAAVGSAVNEDPQDAQSLMFPITLPIILAIIIMVNAIRQPDSSLATWSSMIPFFSPIVMMARLPFGPAVVPWWQLGLSMFLLVSGFVFTIWLSAKIYRTGILMYGKKANLKELAKWAMRK